MFVSLLEISGLSLLPSQCPLTQSSPTTQLLSILHTMLLRWLFLHKRSTRGIVCLTYVKEKPDGSSLYFFNHSVSGWRELLVLVTSCLGQTSNGPSVCLLVVHVKCFKSGYGFSYPNYQTKALKRLSLSTCMIKTKISESNGLIFEAICNGWIFHFVSWTIQQFVRVKRLSADWKLKEMWAHFSGSRPVANILF